MKKNIHPKLFMNAKVTDLSSGETFVIPSTKEEISIEVSNLSHPFYTGKQRIVDTENLVKKFESKRSSANSSKVTNKKDKKSRRNKSRVTSINAEGALTLKDMLKQFK